MNWDKIRAQEFAVRILKAHGDHKRLASTYLITGNQASGKEDVALGFALSLLCSQKRKFESCECSVCTRILGRNHPDVRWGPPLTARSIKIEEVRELMGWASFKPYEGEWKIFILEGADRLTLEAANAFLKTLEEPPKQTIFCLLCESKAQVLETIQSRSFEIRLRPLGEETTLPPSFPPPDEAGGGIRWGENWEDCLDQCQAMKREELKVFFDALMEYFRGLIQKEAERPGGNPELMTAWLEALDKVYESKDALDANANQKLILSRLAMQLRGIVPPTFILPHVVGEDRRGQ